MYRIPNRIFVGGIPQSASQDELRDYFSHFGHVKDARIISDQRGNSRGYGFVTYDNENDASKVLSLKEEELVFKDNRLNIGHAFRKKNFGGGPGMGGGQPGNQMGGGNQFMSGQGQGGNQYMGGMGQAGMGGMQQHGQSQMGGQGSMGSLGSMGSMGSMGGYLDPQQMSGMHPMQVGAGGNYNNGLGLPGLNGHLGMSGAAGHLGHMGAMNGINALSGMNMN